MTDLASLTTIAQQAKALQSHQISSVELTQFYLDRIQQLDPQLNSYITVLKDKSLIQAQQADERLKTPAPPLCGIPIAVKDIFCTQDDKTSCGSKMLDNFISPYDATVISRLKEAGCIILGKTNMDEFAMGSSNETSFYGPVKNPWQLDCVPGGSSGGSAACVSANLATAAIGTDTGGSIRQPAAFCGITGLKPTYGRVSRFGMVAFASSLDQGGPMTKTAEDAALLLQTMAGHDAQDATSVATAVPDYLASLNKPLAGLRIGLAKEHLSSALNPHMAAIIHEVVQLLTQQGASVHHISLPHTDLSIPVYYLIAPAEASSNLSRYDGVRYGYRCDNPRDLTDLYCRSRGEGFGEEVKRRIMLGTYALSSGYYDAYYLHAQKVRQLISQDFVQAFEQVDLILGPTTPEPAFALNEKSHDPISMYLNDIYTISVNLAGLPALSMPAGQIKGLPVGVQLIGQHFAEAQLLNVAHQFQQLTTWHQAQPPLARGNNHE